MNMKNLSTKRIALLSGLLAIFVLAMAGVTLAVLVDDSNEVKNVFDPSEVTCEVYETFADGVKKDVKIRNTGDADAYIRAAVIVTWQDGSGNIASSKPVSGEDYSMTFYENNNWEEKDGYYYYTKRVAAGDESYTEALIKECKALKSAPEEGYYLSVEIIADAVQADGVNENGTKAVVDAWGVDPETLE